MNSILLNVILISSLLGGGYLGFKKWEADIREAESKITSLELKIAQQELAITVLNNRFEETLKEVQTLEEKRKQLETETNEYMSIFRKHDLTNLSKRKPQLIETRINNATDKVFSEIENITKDE